MADAHVITVCYSIGLYVKQAACAELHRVCRYETAKVDSSSGVIM
jgi:hypothetical protein